ncbi:hypothetical protein [Burkholderia ubonensis]|uniref:hypothetical protein n=1 Tax=Burkholderia ubonensis TaxID=101571 RepID=UPI0011604A6F|nr:hypothetical protein [Burkholderia ubonensis]
MVLVLLQRRFSCTGWRLLRGASWPALIFPCGAEKMRVVDDVEASNSTILREFGNIDDGERGGGAVGKNPVEVELRLQH